MLSAEEQETLETYNQIADEWTATLSDTFWQQEYQKFLSYLPTGKILDIGCGSGRDSKWLCRYGYQVVGIDLSPAMIKLAKTRAPAASFFVQDIYHLDFPPASFDGFWATNTFLHIPKNNIADVLAGLKQVLKPGAIGFVSMKDGQGESMDPWQKNGRRRYFVRYQQDEFAQVLTSAGLQILEQSKMPPKTFRQDGTFLLYYVKKI